MAVSHPHIRGKDRSEFISFPAHLQNLISYEQKPWVQGWEMVYCSHFPYFELFRRAKAHSAETSLKRFLKLHCYISICCLLLSSLPVPFYLYPVCVFPNHFNLQVVVHPAVSVFHSGLAVRVEFPFLPGLSALGS